MGKETLLKIGQIGCTALAGFLGICLTQLSIDKAVDNKVKALESTDKKRMRTNSGPLPFLERSQNEQ